MRRLVHGAEQATTVTTSISTPLRSASASFPPAFAMSAPSDSSDVIDPDELKQAEEYLGRDNFVKLHKPQLMAMKMPPNLIHPLYDKLLAEQFDAVDSFQVEYVEEEGFRVVCKKEEGLKAGQDVWLIDHMWTTTADKAQQQLREIDGLVDRLWALADMERRLEQDRQEERAARTAAAASSPQTAAAAAASAPVHAAVGEAVACTPVSCSSVAATPAAATPFELDCDSIAAIMCEGNVSRERAIDAYTVNKGDLIQAITWCTGDSKREAQMQDSQMMQLAEAQAVSQDHVAAADAAATPFDSSALSTAAKAQLLWPWLFKAGLVGCYHTTLLNDVSSASLTADAVQSVMYVNDEVGSAVAQVSDTQSANAVMAPFVCVTVGGVAFSLLWLTKDVKLEEEIKITRRDAVRLQGVPQV